MNRSGSKNVSLASRHFLAVIAVAVLAAVLYIPSINGEFIFDDDHNIVDNPIVKDLSYYTNPSQATDFDMYKSLERRPVGYLTLAVNYLAGGLDTTG
jgi:hypothetical protein